MLVPQPWVILGCLARCESLSKPHHSWHVPARAAPLCSRTWGGFNSFGWTASAVSVCTHTQKPTNPSLEKQLPNSLREQVSREGRAWPSCSHLCNGWQSCRALETPEIHLGRHSGCSAAFRGDPAALALNSASLTAWPGFLLLKMPWKNGADKNAEGSLSQVSFLFHRENSHGFAFHCLVQWESNFYIMKGKCIILFLERLFWFKIIQF